MSFDENLQRSARRLAHRTNAGDASVPPRLRDRVLNALPEAPRQQNPQTLLERALFPTTFVVGFTITLFIGVKMLHRPETAPKPRPLVSTARPLSPETMRVIALADAMNRAMYETVTGHLKGWKVEPGGAMGGSRTPWEIYWQRQPQSFFYREQLGDEILIDSGGVRTHVWPMGQRARTSQGKKRPAPYMVPGIVLARPSESVGSFFVPEGLASNLLDRRYLAASTVSKEPSNTVKVANVPYHPQTILTENGMFTSLRLRSPISGNLNGLWYRQQTGTLTLNSATNLPIGYMDTLFKAPWVNGEESASPPPANDTNALVFVKLDVDYNKPIPSDLQKVRVPKGYLAINTDKMRHEPPLKITLQNRDEEGNTHIRVEALPGSLLAQIERIPNIVTIQHVSIKGIDEAGHQYLSFGTPKSITCFPFDMFLVPVEPLSGGGAPPIGHLKLSISLSVRFDGGGVIPDNTPSDVWEADVALSLPKEAVDLGFTPGKLLPGMSQTLAETSALTRAEYYSRHLGLPIAAVRGSKLPLSAQEAQIQHRNAQKESAARWWRAAAEEARRQGARGRVRRYASNADDVLQSN